MSYKDYWDRFKTNRTKSEGKSKTLWSDDYDFDDSKFAGVSVSRTGNYIRDYGEKVGSSSNIDKLNRVACNVIRLLNSVQNSENGKEKVLAVKWASESDSRSSINPKSNTILVDPEQGIEADESPEMADAIGGRCLIAATQMKTVAPAQRQEAHSDLCLINAGHFVGKVASFKRCQIIAWEAIESSKATRKLVEEWPGSTAYIHRHKVTNCASQDEVQKFVDKNENVEGCVAAYSWTINNPSNPINIPKGIETALIAAIEETERVIRSEEGAYTGTAARVIDSISKILPFKEDEKSGGGKGDDGKGGDGKPDGKPDFKIPNSSDSTLLSEVIRSKYNESDLPDKIKTIDNLDIFDVPKIPEGCASFEIIKVLDVSKIKLNANPIRIVHNEREAYKNLTKSSKKITESIVSALRFRANEQENPIYGFQSGDIDEGALHRIATRRNSDDRIYQRREIVSFPYVLFGMLVDQSGSMTSSTGNGSRRILDAQLVCVGVHEALKRIKKVDQYIAGHDSNNGCHTRHRNSFFVSIYEYYSKNNQDSTMLCRMEAGHNNGDGYAIQKSVERMALLYPEHSNKSLCVISDGAPNANGCDGSYGGFPAMKHIKNVCDWAWRKHRVRVIGIGVANAFAPSIGDMMYGEGNYAIIGDVMSSERIISRFLQKVTSKMG